MVRILEVHCLFGPWKMQPPLLPDEMDSNALRHNYPLFRQAFMLLPAYQME